MAPKSGVHDLMGAKQVSFESPGIKMQHDQEAIKILDPTHPENRETLHAMYGISLPLIVQEKDYVHVRTYFILELSGISNKKFLK